MIWNCHCFDFLIGFCHVITMTGIPQRVAYATHVTIFVAQGQSVANATPSFQVNLQ